MPQLYYAIFEHEGQLFFSLSSDREEVRERPVRNMSRKIPADSPQAGRAVLRWLNSVGFYKMERVELGVQYAPLG